MHDKIQKLPAVLIDRVAAGEVIEAPFSVIKELIENSLDANATKIRIDTSDGGNSNIFIQDNGKGIANDELKLSIERHATSKIRNLNDLEQLHSFGFRGEALAAISSVSYLELRSRTYDAQLGRKIESRGGEMTVSESCNCPPGTSIQVSDLFYTTPARRKYLKNPRTENIRNLKQITRLAIGNPSCHFVYYRDDKLSNDWEGSSETEATNPLAVLKKRIIQVYGDYLDKYLIPIDTEYAQDDGGSIKMHGYIISPEYLKANRDMQFHYVNGRFVEVENFSFFMKKAYGELIQGNMHPCYFLFLDIDPSRVDVNVHPQKKEVRLRDKDTLHNLIVRAVSEKLRPSLSTHINWDSHSPSDIPVVRSELSDISPASPASPTSHLSEKKSLHDENLARMSEVINGTDLESENKASPTRNSKHEKLLEKLNEENIATLSSNIGRKPSIPVYSHTQPKKDIDTRPSQPPSSETIFSSKESQNLSFFSHKTNEKLKIIGLLWRTFILIEQDNMFYIVDQHTVHERINYEKQLALLEKNEMKRQLLLEPIVIHCLADELELVLEKTKELEECGFLIEALGKTSYVVREVPNYLAAGTEEKQAQVLVQRVLEGEKSIRLYEDYAAMRACKASIKKNDNIAVDILYELLDQLKQCKQPTRCPHGRPTIISLSQSQVERMFYRA